MINIRKASADDVDILYDLILEIAKYHHQEHFVLTNNKELLKAGFQENPKFGVLLAEYNKKIVGYVSFTFNYSIWTGSNYLNIDDLFVLKEYRGKKIGELLMINVKELCTHKGISKIKWEVERENKGAIKFYEGLGASLKIKGIFHWNL